MFYYALIVLSVVMFGGNFALNDLYRRLRGGGGWKITLQSTLIGAAAGLVTLWLINGFRFEFTLFTFLIALCTSVNSLLMSYCSFKALGYINLSLYSLFTMLGGMLLPFFQGILFFGEPITLGKTVCCLFIIAALLLTVERGKKKKGAIFYLGIFLCNGMSGVLSKIFASAPYEKTGSAGYSILTALTTLLLSLILLFTLTRRMPAPRLSPAPVAVAAVGGTVNKVANYLLVLALAGGIDASIQYPMVTGGVMIVSTAVAALGKTKPKKREILSVALAFIGLLLLFLIPV